MVVYELSKLLFKFWMIFGNKYLWGIKRPEATVATLHHLEANVKNNALLFAKTSPLEFKI